MLPLECDACTNCLSLGPVMAHITLYCQPGAKQTRHAGLHDGCVKVQLKAPPVEGAANAALVAYVAQCCGVAKSQVRIVSGLRSRMKRVAVEGVTQAQLDAVWAAPEGPAS